MKTVLRLGTRRSMLAWAQSSQVARHIESLHPEIKIEMIGIETKGDQIVDIPLRETEGKDFFVRELDQALLESRVDLTVHSLKDLSTQRPEGISTAAIGRRKAPHDIAIFSQDIEKKILSGNPLVIGTSSPRRIENLPPFLSRALPKPKNSTRPPEIQCVNLRGNINTRLRKLRSPQKGETPMDGIVLALAGLSRLWIDEDGNKELKPLLQGLRRMVLPLSECPTAPAQGALAIECRSDDLETRKILSSLDDLSTRERVTHEREILRKWGGGCHQRFGATEISTDLGPLLFQKGVLPDGTPLNDIIWQKPAPPSQESKAREVRAWNGNEWRSRSGNTSPLAFNESEISADAPCFVAHWRALENTSPEAVAHVPSLWTSGVKSWFHLAEQGHWIEGCFDQLGLSANGNLIQEEVLCYPDFPQWTVLTHGEATRTWPNAKVIATYDILPSKMDSQAIESLSKATHVYWGSADQFKRFHAYAKKDAHHACGAGKTKKVIEKVIRDVIPFPSLEEWKKWTLS